MVERPMIRLFTDRERGRGKLSRKRHRIGPWRNSLRGTASRRANKKAWRAAAMRFAGFITITALITMLAAVGAAHANIVVRVDKSAQRMHVLVDGEVRHKFVVSTGLAGGPPTGSFKPQRLERKWHSRLFNMAPMPYSIFFHGNFAIHGTNAVRKLGQRASHGCVRLHPDNAATLFNLVQKRGNGEHAHHHRAEHARAADLQPQPKAEIKTDTKAEAASSMTVEAQATGIKAE